MTAIHVLTLLAVTACGLIAGLFYGYSCSVNPGLGRLSDAAYVSAMQSINKAILNPLFFASFMGTLVLLPAAAYLHYRAAHQVSFVLLSAAAVLYIAGVFGITVGFNVPLNNALALCDPGSATSETVEKCRRAFERPWNRWHAIRTVASVISLVLAVAALIKR